MIYLGAANLATAISPAPLPGAADRSLASARPGRCAALDGAGHPHLLCLFRASVVSLVLRLALPCGPLGRRHHGAGRLGGAAASPARRGIVGGVIFAGVDGIAASGTLVPLLLQLGCAKAGGLGALSATADADQLGELAEERQRGQNCAAASRTSQPSVARRPGAARRIRPQCLRSCRTWSSSSISWRAVSAKGCRSASHYWVFMASARSSAAGRGHLRRRSLASGGAAWPSWSGDHGPAPAISTSFRFADRIERGHQRYARHRAAGAPDAFMNCCHCGADAQRAA